MGAVGADGELELHEQLGGFLLLEPIVPPAQLGAELRELARPEGQDQRPAGVGVPGVGGAVGGFEAAADEPAPGELIVGGGEPAQGALIAAAGPRLLAFAGRPLAPHAHSTVATG